MTRKAYALLSFAALSLCVALVAYFQSTPEWRRSFPKHEGKMQEYRKDFFPDDGETTYIKARVTEPDFKKFILELGFKKDQTDFTINPGINFTSGGPTWFQTSSLPEDIFVLISASGKLRAFWMDDTMFLVVDE